MKQLSSFLKSTILFFSALIIFLSFISYSPKDIAFLSYPAGGPINNLIGVVGAYLAALVFFLFGAASYFFPFYILFLGLDQLGLVNFQGLGDNKIIKTISFIFFTIFLSTFIGLFSIESVAAFNSSGIVGFFLAGFFVKYLGIHGCFITFSLLLLVSAILLFGHFFLDLWHWITQGYTAIAELVENWIERRREAIVVSEERPRRRVKKKVVKPEEIKEEKSAKDIKPEIRLYTPKVEVKPESKKPVATPVVQNQEEVQKKMKELEGQAAKAYDPKTYQLPTLDLLTVPIVEDHKETKGEIQSNIKDLEAALAQFGVEAKVVSVQKGPVVTMYEMQPSAGVKIQQITTLADDIALAMKASSVRVVAPIPGRGTVGIEVPNLKKMMVSLREVLEEKTFVNSSSKLTIAIGKDVSGNPVVADLKDMPHLLIAGATGAGKTVCMNALISSILYKSKPHQVKFIMIDPKMVELAPYAGIPHLIHPIISEAKKAFVALQWAVEEMERRYRLLADEGARNVDAYNRSKSTDDILPYIVIVVDELADLMVVARDSVETAIQRLAQLARAVGIHLVLATQRPSVDVITGVIKANFPARISFKVSAKVDSRTVLDAMGADKLLGKGDLLFLKPGAVKLIRAQGAFVTDDEIGKFTDFLRRQGSPQYEEKITEGAKKAEMDIGSDELFDEAVKTILQAKQASASILQRRLRVGYTRAARLLDMMEQAGIVGPFCGSKAREILVDPIEYLEEQESEAQ